MAEQSCSSYGSQEADRKGQGQNMPFKGLLLSNPLPPTRPHLLVNTFLIQSPLNSATSWGPSLLNMSLFEQHFIFKPQQAFFGANSQVIFAWSLCCFLQKQESILVSVSLTEETPQVQCYLLHTTPLWEAL
jgi:hypothetical protein